MKSNQQVEQFLTDTQTHLQSTLQEPALLERIAPFGYAAEDVQALLDDLDEAQALYQAQHQEYAQQYTATQRVEEKIGEVRQRFMRHRRIARVAFEPGSEAFTALELNGSVDRAYTGLIQQASRFYRAIRSNPSIQETLSELTLTPAAVADALADLSALQDLRTIQQNETAQAQEATKSRDAAVLALRGKMADFVEIARLATEDRPQLRELLGITTE